MKSITYIESAEGLGATIRQARKRQALTQAELAQLADVSRSFIIDLEDGHPRAELGKVLSVLRALDAPLAAVVPVASVAATLSAGGKGIPLSAVAVKSGILNAAATPPDRRVEYSVMLQRRARDQRAHAMADVTSNWSDGQNAPDPATQKLVNAYIEGTMTLSEAMTKLKKLSAADQ